MLTRHLSFWTCHPSLWNTTSVALFTVPAAKLVAVYLSNNGPSMLSCKCPFCITLDYKSRSAMGSLKPTLISISCKSISMLQFTKKMPTLERQFLVRILRDATQICSRYFDRRSIPSVSCFTVLSFTPTDISGLLSNVSVHRSLLGTDFFVPEPIVTGTAITDHLVPDDFVTKHWSPDFGKLIWQPFN